MQLATGRIPETPESSINREPTMPEASVDRDRTAFKRRCRRIGLLVKGPSLSTCNGLERTVPIWRVAERGMNFRDGEQSSEIRSLFSFLRVLFFNLVAHLHRRVLTRGPPRQERFPELFTGQLVNFVPLLFISAVIDSVIHIFSSRFFRFLQSLSLPSVIRGSACETNKKERK